MQNVKRGAVQYALIINEQEHDKTNTMTCVRPTKRLRSAWASAHSDQSLPCPHEDTSVSWLPTERTEKTLIGLGKCPG